VALVGAITLSDPLPNLPPMTDTTPRRRAGPVYDDAMKILADDDLAAVLSLVGVRERAERLNVELPATTMKADLLARTPSGIVHVEFVKDTTPDLDLRMFAYRLRLRRRDRNVSIEQFLLTLRDIPVPDRFDDVWMSCSWNVIAIRDLDPVLLLQSPTTAAIAALARGSAAERTAILVAAAELITAHTDPDRRDLLLGAAATLASIVLPRRTITSALKEAAMPVPVRDTPLGRELYQEGRKEGRTEGRQEGRQEGEQQAVLRMTAVMLRRRFSADEARITAVAARLAALPDDDRIALILGASSLDDLLA
jgi:hypothetical protein